MDTDQDLCLTCGSSSEEHQRQWEKSSFQLAVLLRAKEYGYPGEIDSVIDTWRWHGLPECDPLALS